MSHQHLTGEMLYVNYGLTSKVPVGANTTVNLVTGAALLLLVSEDFRRFGKAVSWS
ncbi:hypothetical protein [Microcoleus vaginatus]|uniref:hypothetical protein n=1 Tax=Microcoleus vaginatus TaxID=119532 RepID=UPI001F60C278